VSATLQWRFCTFAVGARAQLSVSVVVPVLNDAPALAALLEMLASSGFECVVVDGGSTDDSLCVAHRHDARVVCQAANRGAQLDIGWRAARGEWIWFVHADSGIDTRHLDALQRIASGAPAWGRFDVCVADPPGYLGPVFGWRWLVGSAMNLRSALTHICTGDQAIFAHRDLLRSIRGVPRQPLMEDVELSKRLRRISRPVRCRERIGTDARRWRRDGVLRTILSMWAYRIRYFFGGSPDELARRYYRHDER